jgi:SAM-dependent methyltransferase
MRRYWDERARDNAAFYVDTTMDYDRPDMERFFRTGREVVREALDDAPVRPARTGLAVEIGCGLGRVCAALAERFDEVVGVDVSAEMLRRARELVPDPRVRFDLGDGTTLSTLEDASADFVVSFTVFQHVPDPVVVDRYLAEAGRVLRPGGVAAFQWNNTPGSLRWAIRRTLLSALQRSGLRREARLRNDAAFLGSRIPLRRVARSLEAGGLELAGTRGEGTLFAWAWAVRR